jgi:SAM-dependent methyltransferase
MDWKDGYITEVEYVHGVYRELGPSVLNFILLLQSMEPVPLEQGFTYCDLGCGQGESVNLFAACHPEGQFHAIDFNYAHIAGARNLARQANIGNATFWEASFADLGGLDLPQFDFITLHGIYSWVGPENRQRIVDFLRRQLKPGGVVYVSYNSLPGWSTHAPLRHLLSSYADTQSGPLEERVDRAIKFVEGLKTSGASFFEANPSSKDFFDYICTLPRNYVTHEFFNRDWTLFYHAEVVRNLAAAKLSFVGSANFAENQDMLRFSAPLQQVLDGVSDRVMRETVKDFAVGPLLRRDVFTRGGRRISPAAQLEYVGATLFALVVPQARIERKAFFPIGEVLFDRELYDPILFALEEKPQSLEGLLERRDVGGLGKARVVEALMVLLSAEYVMPAVEPALYTLMTTRTLNNAIIERHIDNIEKKFLASPVVQSAIKVDWLERLLLLCEIREDAEPQSFVWGKMEANNHMLTRNGEVLQSKEENMEELARVIGTFRSYKLPLLHQLGVF